MNLADKFSIFFAKFGSAEFVITFAVSVIALTVLFYYLVKFLFSNNAGIVVVLFVFIMIISTCIVLLSEDVSNTFLLVVIAVCIVLVVALYSVEIKHIIWLKRNQRLLDARHAEGRIYDTKKVQKCISEIIKALQNMAKNDIGAIIVLASSSVPAQILDSGVMIDSDISRELIESVFFPKTPLHDGAMIISGTRIVAAGCFLPLSQQIENIPKDLGTRHRAGIGVTETLDFVSIIVSEETGIISIAKAGKITRYADLDALKRVLGKYYWQEMDR